MNDSSQNNIKIQPFNSIAEEQLLQSWKTPENLDEAEGRALFIPSRQKPYIYSVTAVDENFPIAAASIAQANLEPGYAWVYVEVEPSWRRHDIGSSLHANLEEHLQKDNSSLNFVGLRSKVEAGTEGEKFALAKGYKPVHTIATYQLDTEAITSKNLEESGPIIVEDLATGSVELTEKLAAYFAKTQQISGREMPSLGKIQQVFLGPQSGAHGALVVRNKEKEILAFAVSYPLSTTLFNNSHELEESLQNLAAVEESGNNAETSDQNKPTRVIIGYDMDSDSSLVSDGLEALLSLLVYQQPIIVEVPEKAQLLSSLLLNESKKPSPRVHVKNQSKVLFKTLKDSNKNN